MKLAFSNAHLKLPVEVGMHGNKSRMVRGAVFSRVPPQPIEAPQLVAISPSALALVGAEYSDEAAVPEAAVLELSGNAVPPGAEPLAHCYAGFQFGYFSGQLGDGAAILLGESHGWELQLKGAGHTPFSRDADGRKVLRSSLRELFASEFMAAAGVPTTRAGSLVVSFTSRVLRDPLYNGRALREPCAVLSRIAQTFLRFGSFEICLETSPVTGRAGPSPGMEEELLRPMLQWVNERFFGDAHAGPGGPEERFFFEVVERTARLCAHWQAIGFCHGVLNTDNMSVLGLTLDYGPYGFLTRFDPNHVSNTSDHNARYTYAAQPDICAWNLQRLALALEPLLAGPIAPADIRSSFDRTFLAHYAELFARKLGLKPDTTPAPADGSSVMSLAARFLELLDVHATDFAQAFAALSLLSPADAASEAVVAQGLQRASLSVAALADALGLHTWTPENEERLTQLLEISRRDEGVLAQIGVEQSRMVVEARLAEKRRDVRRRLELPVESRNDADANWGKWLGAYRTRVAAECAKDAEWARARVEIMRKSNPKYVPWNFAMQRAIDAAEKGNFAPTRTLLAALCAPFDEHPEADDLFHVPEGGAVAMPVSCSS